MFDRTAAQRAYLKDKELLEQIQAARDAGKPWDEIDALEGETAEERHAAWLELMERSETRIKEIREHDAEVQRKNDAATTAQAEERSRMVAVLGETVGPPPTEATRSNPNAETVAGADGVKRGAVPGASTPPSYARPAARSFAQHIGDQIGNPGKRNTGQVDIKLPMDDKPDLRNFYNPADAKEVREHRAMMSGRGIHVGETRAVDTTAIPTAATQQMGIVQDRAEFYAAGRLPLVYADEMRTRGDQWNESNTTIGTPTVTTGETDAAVEYSPTTIKRNIYPADSRITIKVSKRSLQNRSDWEDYLQFKLMQKFWEVVSPEAIYSAGTIAGLVSVGNAAFHQTTSNSDPLLNPTNGITKVAYSITDSLGKGVAIANSVGDALDTMGGLAPGPKSIICRRQVASAYRRHLGDATGVALQRSGVMNLDIEGAALAPVDVGFEAEAATKLQGVISDFPASSEFLISWLEVQILYETSAKTGQLEFLLNIGRAFRWDSRFQFGLLFAAA